MTKKALAKRREWIRANMGEPISLAVLRTRYAQAFSIRDEDKAGEELKELLAEDRAVDEDLGENAFACHLALGEKIMAQILAAGDLSSATAMWKALTQAKGFEKQKLEVNVTSAPSAETVRARIGQLLADQRVREQAEKINVDVDALATTDTQSAISPDSSVWHLNAPKTQESQANEPSAPSDPAPSTDAGAPNVVADYVAAALPKDR